MNTHLLRVSGTAPAHAAIFAAAAALELRVGWLELAEHGPEPLPPALAEAAREGALRAVAIGGGRSVAIKPMRGAPVLKDVLREHFSGCALVLVHGDIDLPLLERDDARWRVTLDDESRTYSAESLAAALRKPRAFAFD